jgi:hypothetical protein
MKRLAIILSDLIPLVLTVIFVIVVALILSHVTDNPVAAMSQQPPKTKLECPRVTAAKAAQSENVNEAARSGELDLYISQGYP